MKHIVTALKILKNLSDSRFWAVITIILLAQFIDLIEVTKTFNS